MNSKITGESMSVSGVVPLTDQDLIERGLPMYYYVRPWWVGRNGKVVARIRRGELGYEEVEAQLAPREMNALAGITREQARAMCFGARFGWRGFGAHPRTWIKPRADASASHVCDRTPVFEIPAGCEVVIESDASHRNSAALAVAGL